ncbi:metallophosphoesterase family protein [Microlunatus speluncae]|uniref:metallophosphoesterase family protein n=1 Tax=Microlunatus speluncae TaxID=2594267 RepID=UPI001266114A|nr:metallophosphoesterase family protein [Microlunatus speluncae]
MLNQVAVLSDIHGVLPVLEAILAEPDVVAADKIVITGDHVAGPQPVEVLDLLAGLGDRVILVRGNADREVVALAHTPDPRGYPESLWAGSVLRADQLERLAALPHPVTLELAGFGAVVFCHGTPRDDDEVVLVDSPVDRWMTVLGELGREIRFVVCGHTHMPYVRLVDRRTVINPGSVGMPYGTAGGAWALLRDGQISLRRTATDPAAVIDRVVRESAYPGVAGWAETYLTGAISDLEALAAMRPRTESS